MSAAAAPEIEMHGETGGADAAAAVAADSTRSLAPGGVGEAGSSSVARDEAVIATGAEAVVAAAAQLVAAASGEEAPAAAAVISTPRPTRIETFDGFDSRWDALTLASPGFLSLKRLAANAAAVDADSSGSGSATDCSSSLPSTEPSTTPSESSASNDNHKRLKVAPRRSKKSKHLQLPHPLGVKPLGNAFLVPSGQNSRPGSLGSLASLDDDLIVHILGLLADADVISLARLEGTSRGLYAFVNSVNAIWRDCFLQRFEGRLKKWCGSWKRTYIWHYKLDRLVHDGQQFNDVLDGSSLTLLEPPSTLVRTPYLFSDTLFHPFRLSLTPLDHYLSVEAAHIPISHIDVSKPGAVARFRDQHAEANVPAIIEGAMSLKDWPCREWTLETLAARWPNRFFQCEAVRCRLPTYLSYAKSMDALCKQAQKDNEGDDGNGDEGGSGDAGGKTSASEERRSKSCLPLSTPGHDGSSDQKQLHVPLAMASAARAPSLDRSSSSSLHSGGSNLSDDAEASFNPHAIPDESPFYLFDAAFADDPHVSLEWRVPKIFHQTSAEVPDLFGHTAGVRSDLFSLLGPLRPDHRWIVAGPARSGSGWHKDPNGTAAWNAVLTGRKAWMMLPPHATPPGVYVSDDEAEVTAPLSIAEWLIGFAHETRRTYGPSAARPEDRVLLEGVCEAGEVLYVPSGWWHLVVNLEESVALTQNFVSPPELGIVLDFMKNRADQLSGFKKQSSGGARPAVTGDMNSKEVEEVEECEDGAGFGVYELFCDRLGKFDRKLLSNGLEKMAAIEAKRERGHGAMGRTCLRIVRGKGDGDAAMASGGDRGETWWDKLRKQRSAPGGPDAASAAEADKQGEGPTPTSAAPLGGDEAGTTSFGTFLFGAQLDAEELEAVPW